MLDKEWVVFVVQGWNGRVVTEGFIEEVKIEEAEASEEEMLPAVVVASARTVMPVCDWNASGTPREVRCSDQMPVVPKLSPATSPGPRLNVTALRGEVEGVHDDVDPPAAATALTSLSAGATANDDDDTDDE